MDMDFHLKQQQQQQQWGDQLHESEQQQLPLYFASAKTPRQLLNIPPPHYQYFHHQEQEQQEQEQETISSEPALPLFVPEPEPPLLSTKSSNQLSAAYPDSTPPTPRVHLPRMGLGGGGGGGGGGYFSLAQMQELELQALIYRHMVAGAAVPPELLQLVKKSLLLNSPQYYNFLQHNNNYPYHPPNWYWGRAAMDPEPGRCRRTDGKKWRCSRDVVVGQRYCERHIHRGRNRSRKPVEFPTCTAAAVAAATTTTVDGGGGGDNAGTGKATNSIGTHFSLSGAVAAAAMDMFQLHQGLSESKQDKKSLFELQHQASAAAAAGGGGGNSDNRVLRCFFDDWPRSSDHSENISAASSSTSTPINPSSSSDFLRLSTGGSSSSSNGHEPGARPSPVNWWGGSSSHVASVGGPLAEALRSSTGSSPTSVLHQLQRGSVSDTSFVSA
ncbi:hypothetical protein Dimus_007036 [Dionaea muscipula]